jgi:ABC-type multidrug transport system fused ATPase/permease subunit
VLFKGTIRSNLDPFNQEDDETLWKALSRVHMADFVSTMPDIIEESVENKSTSTSATLPSNLSTSSSASNNPYRNISLSRKAVSEKGSNLSVGQRQLLCMARAILKKATILVMGIKYFF